MGVTSEVKPVGVCVLVGPKVTPEARLRARDLRPSAAARREHLRGLVLAEIETSLADPDLCPELIGRRVGVSRRYLHDLFSDQGYTVGRWILERRLERSFADILASREHALRIGEIATVNGFRDPSYFSRAFKRRFGMTPRALAAGARQARGA